MKADRPESTFEQLPAGSYSARLYSIVEIGTEFFVFQGEEKKSKKVRLTFELPTELVTFNEEEGPKPYTVSREFTFSMHKKGNLRPFIENWVGNFATDDEAYEFDMDQLLGQTGMAQVNHKLSKDGTRTYLELSAVISLPKGMKVPDAVNEAGACYYGAWNQDLFDKLPDFLKDKMMKTPEWSRHIGDEEKKANNAPDIADVELPEETTEEVKPDLDTPPF